MLKIKFTEAEVEQLYQQFMEHFFWNGQEKTACYLPQVTWSAAL